jgi:cytochrome c oxidase cbb3-type subunit 2
MLTHDKIERNVGLLIVLTILTISVGGLLEIVPLFFQKSTTTPTNELVKPYSPVRLAGRDIYIREGCYKLPFADDPSFPRRDRALRPLFGGRRVRL